MADSDFEESFSEEDEHLYYDDGYEDVTEEPVQDYRCMTKVEVQVMLDETVSTLAGVINTTHSVAKLLLLTNRWDMIKITENFHGNPHKLQTKSMIAPLEREANQDFYIYGKCDVCLDDELKSLKAASCGHAFCEDCWRHHFECAVHAGRSTSIQCMASGCNVLIPDDYILEKLTADQKEKYLAASFLAAVAVHPNLYFCKDQCGMIFHVETPKATDQIDCYKCGASFCCRCMEDNHYPCDCEMVQTWHLLCSLTYDNSPPSYLGANIKKCPICFFAIEKDGGYDNIYCRNCDTGFCWICLKVQKNFSEEYCQFYTCTCPEESMSELLPQSDEKLHSFYCEYARHKDVLEVTTKVETNVDIDYLQIQKGMWEDEETPVIAPILLEKCRQTLKYSYVYAYFLEDGLKKEILVHIQAELEEQLNQVEVSLLTKKDERLLKDQLWAMEKQRRTLNKQDAP